MIRKLADGRLFAQLDARGRLSLGKFATAPQYKVTVLPNGNIILDPVHDEEPGA